MKKIKRWIKSFIKNHVIDDFLHEKPRMSLMNRTKDGTERWHCYSSEYGHFILGHGSSMREAYFHWKHKLDMIEGSF